MVPEGNDSSHGKANGHEKYRESRQTGRNGLSGQAMVGQTCREEPSPKHRQPGNPSVSGGKGIDVKGFSHLDHRHRGLSGTRQLEFDLEE